MNCQLTLNTRFVHEVCETLVSLSYQTVTFVSLKYDIYVYIFNLIIGGRRQRGDPAGRGRVSIFRGCEWHVP